MSTKKQEYVIHPSEKKQTVIFQIFSNLTNIKNNNIKNNIKNTWKGIKSLNTIKNISTSIPRTLNHNDKTVSNPVKTANIFNNQFVSVAEKTRANVNYSNWNPNKSVDPNSIN